MGQLKLKLNHFKILKQRRNIFPDLFSQKFPTYFDSYLSFLRSLNIFSFRFWNDSNRRFFSLRSSSPNPHFFSFTKSKYQMHTFKFSLIPSCTHLHIRTNTWTLAVQGKETNKNLLWTLTLQLFEYFFIWLLPCKSLAIYSTSHLTPPSKIKVQTQT